ncbi:decapping enzyme complex catalytic subunit DCP2 [Aspergillus tanneri]|nr:mRNA-decapping enzyme subunit 2 [Aspergillus tanneri]KAA8652585.1 mRNA-decapping enzyme subunit 2 [Aspergillus tanneri]
MSQWSHYHHITAFSEFLAYKTRVPVRGAILLNQDMDEVVLVKGWKKGANWSFPRGKINKGEKDLDCAIREVYEETGYDVREAGLVKNENDVKFIEITMREQHMRLYVFRDVPHDAHFEPRTRKEISKIEWYKLSELPTLKRSKQQDQEFATTNVVTNPNKFYMVAPFMHPLKKWIAQQKKLEMKSPLETKQLLQNEREMSTDGGFVANNVMTPNQVPVEMAAPSPLPEVSCQDASAHLKRLLNINATLPRQGTLNTSQASGPDPSKSNALLKLLRSGSSRGPSPQVSSYEQTTPPQAVSGAQPYPVTTLFPGFPQQNQYHGHISKSAQTAISCHQGPMPQFPPVTNQHVTQHLPPNAVGRPFPMKPQGPSGAHEDLPTYAFHLHSTTPYREARLPSGQPTAPLNQAPIPAPYQRTGDPQFAQQAQPSHVQGATVPPASKLPPPKLTSHSLALLNVFKDETTKTPKNGGAAMAAVPTEALGSGRKPSQHQDQLLSLLKGSSVTSASVPVELSGHSVSPAKKQILQRPRDDVNRPQEPVTDLSASPTMSNSPGAKSSAKKAQSAAKRGTNKGKKISASPITILPRPQSAKKEHSPAAGAQPSRHSPRSRPEHKTKSPELPKPFQPQILRRSENLDGILPVRTKVTPDSKREESSQLPSSSEGGKLQANAGRRPSQKASQKEMLLSLFGKQPTASPGVSTTTRINLQTSVPQSSGTSSVVSPLSPLDLSAGAVTDPGAPSVDVNANMVASPDNKAFLLGFLEGVAKGNK